MNNVNRCTGCGQLLIHTTGERCAMCIRIIPAIGNKETLTFMQIAEHFQQAGFQVDVEGESPSRRLHLRRGGVTDEIYESRWISYTDAERVREILLMSGLLSKPKANEVRF